MQEAVEAALIALLRGESAEFDPAELRNAAIHHGLGGPVAYALKDSATLARHELGHRRGLRWLERIGERLDAERVPFVALKGAALGERLYEPRYLRSSSDMDLLVERSYFSQVHRVLTAAGYRPSESTASWIKKTLGHDTAYEHESAPPVEVHDRLHSNFGVRPATAPLLARAVWAELSSGYRVRVLEPLDEFVHLASHAAAHRWEMQRWLYDLVLFAGRNHGMNWIAVAGRARELRLLRSVAATCIVLEAEWGVRTAMEEVNNLKSVVARLRRAQWEGGYGRRFGILLDEMKLCDGPREKGRFAMRAFGAPVLRRVLQEPQQT